MPVVFRSDWVLNIDWALPFCVCQQHESVFRLAHRNLSVQMRFSLFSIPESVVLRNIFSHHPLTTIGIFLSSLIRALGRQILLGAVLLRGLLSSPKPTRRTALVLATGSTSLLFIGRRLSFCLIDLFLFRGSLAGVVCGAIWRCPRSFLLQIQDGPVKHIVVLKALAIKEFFKESL